MPGGARPNVLKVAQSVPGAWPTITALMSLMSSPATLEPVSAKTQPVSGHTTCQIPDIENSCSRDSSRKTPPQWEAPDFPRQRPTHCPLTLGNVGGSPTPGNHTAETALAGWGVRIRTWEWRNSNPPILPLISRTNLKNTRISTRFQLIGWTPIQNAPAAPPWASRAS